MTRLNSKQKGSSFERLICTALSNWVSAGTDADLFWRSSISGGRATMAHRQGRSIRAAGDICSVSPAGHELTEKFFIECKHYANLQLNHFLLGEGVLYAFWEHAIDQALLHKRAPMVIAKENRFPTLLLLLPTATEWGTVLGDRMRNSMIPKPCALVGSAAVYRFDDMMKVQWKIRRT